MTVVSRLLALAVAVALVVGALAIRDRGEDGGPVVGPATGAPLAATCMRDLRALCDDAANDDVAWSSATAATVSDGLAAGDVDLALVPAAWADVADDARDRRGQPALARSAVLASTPIVLVAFADRAEVLAAACGVPVEALSWDCIGEHAGSSWEDLGGDVRWGRVVPGHGPADGAVGLQATASVIASRTGVPFSLNELREVDFSSWFGRLERAVDAFRPAGGSHLTGMVTRGPSVANVATATEAEVVRRDLATVFGDIVVIAPDPLFAVELVVVGASAEAVDDLVARLDTTALAEAGWRLDPATAPEAGLPTLPAPTTSPSGGVLTAVLSTWRDIAT